MAVIDVGSGSGEAMMMIVRAFLEAQARKKEQELAKQRTDAMVKQAEAVARAQSASAAQQEWATGWGQGLQRQAGDIAGMRAEAHPPMLAAGGPGAGPVPGMDFDFTQYQPEAAPASNPFRDQAVEDLGRQAALLRMIQGGGGFDFSTPTAVSSYYDVFAGPKAAKGSAAREKELEQAGKIEIERVKAEEKRNELLFTYANDPEVAANVAHSMAQAEERNTAAAWNRARTQLTRLDQEEKRQEIALSRDKAAAERESGVPFSEATVRQVGDALKNSMTEIRRIQAEIAELIAREADTAAITEKKRDLRFAVDIYNESRRASRGMVFEASYPPVTYEGSLKVVREVARTPPRQEVSQMAPSRPAREAGPPPTEPEPEPTQEPQAKFDQARYDELVAKGADNMTSAELQELLRLDAEKKRRDRRDREWKAG